jgi:hypothetical protein
MAIKLDAMVATIHDGVPVFPSCPAENNVLEKSWALTLSKDGRNADWALAAFALDNLFHRGKHWERDGAIIRASAEYRNDPHTRDIYEQLAQHRAALLRQEHADWAAQPAVALAMKLEAVAQIGQLPANVPTFLDYPPVVIHDRWFNLLLNNWRALSIFVSFVDSATTAKSHRETNIQHSIEICRTHAALAIPSHSKELHTEFFAVLSTRHAFRGHRYRREYMWVWDRIVEMDAEMNPVLSNFQHFVHRLKDYDDAANDSYIE